MTMSQGLFSISGIASGLDTQAIMSQLMQLERIPVNRLQQQQTDLRRVDDAWGQVNTKLSALRSALDKIRRPDHLQSFITVSSSNPDAVAVETRGSGTGSLSFTVNQLASAHQVAGGEGFASSSDLVGAGTFTITVNGVDHTVETTAETTLAGLAKQVGDLDAGVSAKVIKVADGDYQLVMSAKETGEANQFGVSTDLAGFGNVATIQSGQDAVLSVGSLEVRRSSNTIDDLVDGATITLQQVTTGPVTVSAERDIDGAVKAVADYNKALNDVLDTVKKLSAYDAAANKGQPLSGDATARRLVDSLRMAMIGSGAGHTVGFALNRDGAVTLDEAKLRAAFTADFDATVKTLTGVTTSTEAVADGVTSTDPRFVSATSETQAGTYGVQVNAATQATLRITDYVGHQHVNGSTLRLISGGIQVDAAIRQNATPDQAAQDINAALGAAGVTELQASADGADLVFLDERVGPDSAFTLEGLQRWQYDTGTFEGDPLTGTIDGFAATVDGDHLVATEGPAAGLRVLATEAGAFSITLEQQTTQVTTTTPTGLLAIFDSQMKRLEGSGGTIARARESVTGRIKLYQDRIDAFEKRLEQREITLRRQFTALETAMGQLNAQGSWLTSQLAGLQANWDRGR